MGIQEDVEALRRIPMFAKVEPARLKLLAFAAEHADFSAGEIIFRQGDASDSAYIILEGKADVLVTGPEGLLKVAEVGRDSFVGEIGVLCDVPRTATIMATETLHTLRITKDLFIRMIMDFPSIAIEIMRVLGHRLEVTTEKLRDALANHREEKH